MKTPSLKSLLSVAVAIMVLGSTSTLIASTVKISALEPMSGPVGSSVVISGQGFSAVPQSNIVFFGPVRANVVSATTTSLTVAVPAGAAYEPVTVTVGGNTAYSPRPFLVSYSGQASPTSFEARVDVPSGGILRMGTVADLDGDGRPDLIGVNDNNTVTICRNVSSTGSLNSSSFAPAVSFAVGERPYNVAAGDLDGDGKLDLVVAANSSGSFTVLRNTSSVGTISFTRVDIPGVSLAQYAVIADMDLDGKPDVIVSNTGGTGISVFRNTSSTQSITFESPVNVSVDGGGNAAAVADIDGDGKPDILDVSTPYGSNALSVIRNLSVPGQLSFDTRIDFAVGASPRGLAIGDLDGDGKIDAVVTSGVEWYVHPKLVSILRNISTAGIVNFASRIDITSSDSTAWDVRIADFNGDGRPDIAVPYTSIDPCTATIYWNESAPGSMQFRKKSDFASGSNPYGISVADFDLDGKTDILLHLFSGNGFCVFRNGGMVGDSLVSVSLPDTIAMPGRQIEIPVYVSDVTNKSVLAYQFDIEFDTPNAIVHVSDTLGTAGTLSAASGWTAMANVSAPGRISVAGYGPTALAGEGILVKIRFTVDSAAVVEQYCTLHISALSLNAGVPASSATDGKISIRKILCGDADENGTVQAYDAALTLREAIGPMPAPPDPLTAQGRLNVDVDLNGQVQAYDAALILRHVLNLSMPQGVSTCFASGLNRFDVPAVDAPHIISAVGSAQGGKDGGFTRVRFVGSGGEGPVLALTFKVVVPPEMASSEPYLSGYADGTMIMTRRLADGITVFGIVNPTGIALKDLGLTVPIEQSSSPATILFSDIFVNNRQSPDLEVVTSSPGEPAGTFRLLGNYPNPFNPSSRIVFSLHERTQITLEIFNMMGSRVKLLLTGQMETGVHEVSWDGTNDFGHPVASGTYICQMKSSNHLSTIRMLLLR